MAARIGKQWQKKHPGTLKGHQVLGYLPSSNNPKTWETFGDPGKRIIVTLGRATQSKTWRGRYTECVGSEVMCFLCGELIPELMQA